jgi:hypothetical protein
MTIDATITKADLAKYATYYGQRNADAFNGALPGTLVYRTFIGAMDLDTRALVGAHHFDVVKPDADAPAFKFSKEFK